MPEFYLVDAPSRLGLRAAGVEHLPHTLRAVGLTTGLHAIDGGQVAPVPFSPQRDPDTQILNGAAIARFASSLADAVAPIVARQHFPIVLGGDGSILLGPMLALRRRGRYGLVHVDGHADFYQPEPHTVSHQRGTPPSGVNALQPPSRTSPVRPGGNLDAGGIGAAERPQVRRDGTPPGSRVRGRGARGRLRHHSGGGCAAASVWEDRWGDASMCMVYVPRDSPVFSHRSHSHLTPAGGSTGSTATMCLHNGVTKNENHTAGAPALTSPTGTRTPTGSRLAAWSPSSLGGAARSTAFADGDGRGRQVRRRRRLPRADQVRV